jgi:hypothetical protein
VRNASRAVSRSPRDAEVAAGAGEAAFGQGDVGPRHFAHLEPVACGLQFLADQADIVLAQFHEGFGAQDAKIRIDRRQQHVLFDPAQRLAGGEHRFLGEIHPQAALAGVQQHQTGGERETGLQVVDRLGLRAQRRLIDEILAEIGDEIDRGPQRRDGGRHVLVGGAQHGAVLLHQVGVAIGVDQRVDQRLGRRRNRRHQQRDAHKTGA